MDDNVQDNEGTEYGPRTKAVAADGLNWENLREEFRKVFKFNKGENRPWWRIVKTSLIIFATSFAPSFIDMGTDVLSVYNYINGTTYKSPISTIPV